MKTAVQTDYHAFHHGKHNHTQSSRSYQQRGCLVDRNMEGSAKKSKRYFYGQIWRNICDLRSMK